MRKLKVNVCLLVFQQSISVWCNRQAVILLHICPVSCFFRVWQIIRQFFVFPGNHGKELDGKPLSEISGLNFKIGTWLCQNKLLCNHSTGSVLPFIQRRLNQVFRPSECNDLNTVYAHLMLHMNTSRHYSCVISLLYPRNNTNMRGFRKQICPGLPLDVETQMMKILIWNVKLMIKCGSNRAAVRTTSVGHVTWKM